MKTYFLKIKKFLLLLLILPLFGFGGVSWEKDELVVPQHVKPSEVLVVLEDFLRTKGFKRIDKVQQFIPEGAPTTTRPGGINYARGYGSMFKFKAGRDHVEIYPSEDPTIIHISWSQPSGAMCAPSRIPHVKTSNKQIVDYLNAHFSAEFKIKQVDAGDGGYWPG